MWKEASTSCKESKGGNRALRFAEAGASREVVGEAGTTTSASNGMRRTWALKLSARIIVWVVMQLFVSSSINSDSNF